MSDARQRRAPVVNRNPYEVLGVRWDAGETEIHAAYVALARRYHPDLHPNDPRAGERLIAINAAYELLSDPDRRSLYDRQHAAPTPPAPTWEHPSPPRWEPSAASAFESASDHQRAATSEPTRSRMAESASASAEKPLWRSMLVGALVVVLIVARIAAAATDSRQTPTPAGCLGFATDANGRAIKRTKVPCVSIDNRGSIPLRVALLGVTWDRGGESGDLLHVCLGITSPKSGVRLTTRSLSLRLMGSSGFKSPVGTGLPGLQTGFLCGPRRDATWPGFLQDAVFLIPPGEQNHTLLVTAVSSQLLSLGGA